jgi:hypothetical protein
MKSYRNLYPQLITWYNLDEAWRKARKGKRDKAPAASFEYNLEDNLLALQKELSEKTYQPGAYHYVTSANFSPRKRANIEDVHPLWERQRSLGWAAHKRSVLCK